MLPTAMKPLKPVADGDPSALNSGIFWLLSRQRSTSPREGSPRNTKLGPLRRGLHSFTFQLNVSAFCGIGGAPRGNVRAV